MIRPRALCTVPAGIPGLLMAPAHRACNLTLDALLQVCEMLSGMADPEEAQLLRSNVLEEISGKLLPLATDAASSTLLEQVRDPIQSEGLFSRKIRL